MCVGLKLCDFLLKFVIINTIVFMNFKLYHAVSWTYKSDLQQIYNSLKMSAPFDTDMLTICFDISIWNTIIPTVTEHGPIRVHDENVARS